MSQLRLKIAARFGASWFTKISGNFLPPLEHRKHFCAPEKSCWSDFFFSAVFGYDFCRILLKLWCKPHLEHCVQGKEDTNKVDWTHWRTPRRRGTSKHCLPLHGCKMQREQTPSFLGGAQWRDQLFHPSDRRKNFFPWGWPNIRAEAQGRAHEDMSSAICFCSWPCFVWGLYQILQVLFKLWFYFIF